MSIRPAHRQLETNPPWMVRAVFDPDGRRADFTYANRTWLCGSAHLTRARAH